MSYLNSYKNMLKAKGGNVLGSDIQNSQKSIIRQFKNDKSYRLAIHKKRDDSEEELDIRVINNNNNYDEKHITVMPNITCEVGEYVYFDKYYWLIFNHEDNLITPMYKINKCDKTITWDNVKMPACSGTVSSYQTGVNETITTIYKLSQLQVQAKISNSNIGKTIPNWIKFDDLYPDNRFMITQRVDDNIKGIIEITCIKDIYTDSMEILNYHEGVNPDYGYNESYWSIDDGDFKGLLRSLKAEDVTKEWGYDVEVTDVLYVPPNNLITESTLIKKDEVIYKVVKIVECKNPDERLLSYFTIGLVKNENQNIEIKGDESNG